MPLRTTPRGTTPRHTADLAFQSSKSEWGFRDGNSETSAAERGYDAEGGTVWGDLAPAPLLWGFFYVYGSDVCMSALGTPLESSHAWRAAIQVK